MGKSTGQTFPAVLQFAEFRPASEKHPPSQPVFPGGRVSGTDYPGLVPERSKAEMVQEERSDDHICSLLHLHCCTCRYADPTDQRPQRPVQPDHPVLWRTADGPDGKFRYVPHPVCILRHLAGNGLFRHHLYCCTVQCGSHPV